MCSWRLRRGAGRCGSQNSFHLIIAANIFPRFSLKFKQGSPSCAQFFEQKEEENGKNGEKMKKYFCLKWITREDFLTAPLPMKCGSIRYSRWYYLVERFLICAKVNGS